jgi:hypothetical protein
MNVSCEERAQRLNDNALLAEYPLHSVDYKDATNRMNIHATMAVLSPLKYELADWWLCCQSFRPATFVYPDEAGFGDLKQTNGQLMGHPLSFPLLCTINLSCLRVALARWLAGGHDGVETYQEASAIAKAMIETCIINGDDLLFRGPPSVMPFFFKTTSQAGLVTSIGKTISSIRYGTINSQLYDFSKGPGQPVRRIGYLNLNFLYSPLEDICTGAVSLSSLSEGLNEMVRHCPKAAGIVPSAMSRVIKLVRSYQNQSQQLNWYLPTHLGGVGLRPELFGLAPEEIGLTRAQRVLAAQLVADPAMKMFRIFADKLKMSKLASKLGFKAQLVHDDEFIGPRREGPQYQHHSDDGLKNRLMEISAAHRVMETCTKPGTVLARMRYRSRLKPMSDEAIASYRRMKLLLVSPIGAPPASVLPVLRLSFKARRSHANKVW